MERIEPAPKVAEKKVNLVGVRANLPKIFGVLAVIGLILSIGWIIYSAMQPKTPDFKINGQVVQLSKDVVAEINGYERRETENEVLKHYIKADKATVFSDNHQELENAVIQVYDEKGEKFDKISSNKVIYVPNAQNSKLFNAQFTGNVNVESRDGLKVKSELITYDRETEVAESTELVEFERDNVKGKSIGTIVKVKEKQIELLKDVEINANADPALEQDEVAKANLQSAKIVSGYAMVQETTPEGKPVEQKINAKTNVVINLVPLGNQGQMKQPTDVKGDEITAYLVEKKVKKIDLVGNTEIFAKATNAIPEYTKINSQQSTAIFEQELQNATATENVYIETNKNGKPSKIRSQNAVYDKPADKFDLKQDVEIITVEDNQPTVVHSNEAIYEQTAGKIFLNGGANITQGSNFVKGDNIFAQLYPNKKLQYSESKGNAYLRQVTPERTTEITGNELNTTFGQNEHAQNAIAKGNAYLKQTSSERVSEVRGNELNAIFDSNGQLQNANSIGGSNVVLVPAKPQEYSKATMSAPNAIRLGYANGILNQMVTDGRTTVKLDSPNNNPNSANKRVTADTVRSVFGGNGKDLSKVEAVGNAELFVEPLNSAPENYKTTVTAPRFDCDFYEAGNIAKNCTAQTKAKAIRVPTVTRENRGTQTLWADKLNAIFNQQTQDVQQFDAIGNAKFNELDRNGLSNQMTYTASDEVVRLRGGEPTFFDSRARAKAGEIDWDTKNQKSFLREKVGTTYYNQKQTNGATPFTKQNTPVYLTSDNAQFDHVREVGIYTGNARAWQENNYVRANELVIYQKESRFEGEGKVQSLLYNATRKENGKVTNQPAYASSDKINYSDKEKKIQYQSNVDIRQGTDRFTGGLADIYLNENNELKQTIVQENVVITQPNRRITGTWAQYTTADEVAILRGNPATAVDSVQGSTQGSQITVSMRDSKVINQGSTKEGGTGRTKTVYKVKNQ
jgi:LPS export ABC transporter protein LptC/lipopolysaccharide transport protein LptA